MGCTPAMFFGEKRGKSGNSEEKPMSRASAKILGGTQGFFWRNLGACQGFCEDFFGNVVGFNKTCLEFLGTSQEKFTLGFAFRFRV